MLGGSGTDTYYFATGDGNDKIRLAGLDKLDLSGTTFDNFDQLKSNITQTTS